MIPIPISISITGKDIGAPQTYLSFDMFDILIVVPTSYK